MKILLVDDIELQLKQLEKSCKKVLCDHNFLVFDNPLKAFKETSLEKIDIAFLEVEMAKLNGIELAKKLKKRNPQIKIIFVTSHPEYALDAYKIHAFGYIMKPVSDKKIKEEINAIGDIFGMNSFKKLQVKCFGNFEVFHNGEPLRFSYKKSKEVFAYLIDREGSTININELNAVLWEQDHPSYLRNLIADVQNTLKNIGASDVFIKRHNECYIDVNKVDCDAYEYKKGDQNAMRMYRGEYMIQYSWAFFDAEHE